MKNIKTLLAGIAVAWLFIGTPGFAADKHPTNQSVSTESKKVPPTARIIKLDGTEVDLDRLKKESQRLPSSSLSDVRRREKDQSGNEVEVRYNRRVQYFSRNKHIAMIESKILSDEISQGHLKVYRDDGTKVFETKVEPDKDGDYLDYEDVRVLGNHHVITIASKYIGENKSHLDVYDINSNEAIFSTPSEQLRSFQVSPDESYVLLYYVDKGQGNSTYKYNLTNRKYEKIMDNAAPLAFSNDGALYVLANTKKNGVAKNTGFDLSVTTLYFFKSDKLMAASKTQPYETPAGEEYSKNNKFFVFAGHIERKMKENYIDSYKTVYSIFDTTSGRIVTEGQLSREIVEKFKQEILNGDKK